MHRFIIVGLFFALICCSSPSEEIKMNALNGEWLKNEQQQFEMNIQDPQNPKNLIFVVRNNNDYPYSNLRLIVQLENPSKQKMNIDTLNYILAKPNGEWIGTGFGGTKEILFQYKMNYKFPAEGLYKIGIIQAMRQDTLRGIEDIGIKIESAKP